TFYLWIDTILLSLMASHTVVGWYAASTTLVTTFVFLPNVLATTWLPRLVSAFKEGEARLFATARTPVELAVVVSAPILAGIAMAARPVIDTLYGPAYAPAAPAMITLAFCIPPTYFNIMMNQVLIAGGRQ